MARIINFSDGFTSATAPSLTGSTASTTQTLANAQSATNITSLSFSSATYRGAVFEIEVSRKTASSERRGLISCMVCYDTTAVSWTLVRYDEDNSGTDLGVTITITAGGQVQYATDSQSGASYAGTGKWNILRSYGV